MLFGVDKHINNAPLDEAYFRSVFIWAIVCDQRTFNIDKYIGYL